MPENVRRKISGLDMVRQAAKPKAGSMADKMAAMRLPWLATAGRWWPAAAISANAARPRACASARAG